MPRDKSGWQAYMTDDERQKIQDLELMVWLWSDWIKNARAEIRLIRDRCRKRKARAE